MTEPLSEEELVHWKRFILSVAGRLALAFDERAFLREVPQGYEFPNELLILREILSALEGRVTNLAAAYERDQTRFHSHLSYRQTTIMKRLEQIGAALRAAGHQAELILEEEPPLVVGKEEG